MKDERSRMKYKRWHNMEDDSIGRWPKLKKTPSEVDLKQILDWTSNDNSAVSGSTNGLHDVKEMNHVIGK